MPDLKKYASKLNEAQLEAVTYSGGPLLVIAGAGSGKTRVLTYKIAYLLDNGVPPWNILALTFTNKAAKEMNSRIANLCDGCSIQGLWSGTFHSIFAKILRFEHEAIGFPADYTIYDTTDSRSLIKQIVKEQGLDNKVYKPSNVAYKISQAKNDVVLPEDYEADNSRRRRDVSEGIESVYKIYNIYQRRLRAADAMDFDDLLLQTYLLLRNHKEINDKYKNRFRFILVDEFQDTNHVQGLILSLLTNKQSQICVVGDDAQSIYGFRGADISNILGFQNKFPGTKVVKLECNYRSTQTIVEAANSIIQHNQSQIPKKLYAAGEVGEKIELSSALTDKEEALGVLRRIFKLHNNGLKLNEIAVLYRTNAQSRSFEEVFRTAGVSYRIYGGLAFYQRKEIKDAIAYFRLAVNPNDEEAFRRIINYPTRGIGATTLAKIQAKATSTGKSLWQVAANPETFGLDIHAGTKKKINDFFNLVTSFQSQIQTLGAYELACQILKKSGMEADLAQDRTAEGITRQENINELLGAINALEKEGDNETQQTFYSLANYLSSVSLLSETEQVDDNEDRVTLMTIHAAKGLEYTAVFITGLEDDLFPNANAKIFPKELEEERRLLYVAVTRARKFCFLSYASVRFRYGNAEPCNPSPFLEEFDKKYILNQTQRNESLIAGRPFANDRYRDISTNRKTSFSEVKSSPSHIQLSLIHTRQRECPFCHKKIENELALFCKFCGKELPKSSTRTGNSVAPPPGFIRLKNRQTYTSPQPNSPQKAVTRNNTPPIAIGTRIQHERFGAGTIVGIEGMGDSQKIRVQFDLAGIKNLLIKFAKFSIL